MSLPLRKYAKNDLSEKPSEKPAPPIRKASEKPAPHIRKASEKHPPHFTPSRQNPSCGKHLRLIFRLTHVHHALPNLVCSNGMKSEAMLQPPQSTNFHGLPVSWRPNAKSLHPTRERDYDKISVGLKAPIFTASLYAGDPMQSVCIQLVKVSHSL